MQRQRLQGGYMAGGLPPASWHTILSFSSRAMARRNKSSQAAHKNLPAHETKHVESLEYKFRNSAFHLLQRDDGCTNGTALWMGGQVLAAWLAEHYSTKSRSKNRAAARRPRVIELGSGIGLTAYVLFALYLDSHCHSRNEPLIYTNACSIRLFDVRAQSSHVFSWVGCARNRPSGCRRLRVAAEHCNESAEPASW